MGRRLLKGLSAVLAVVMTLTVGMLGVWSTSELSGFTGSLFHDDFSSGLAKWQGFGSPLPNIKTGSGNPAPSFNNNGDGWCDSGAYTTANFDPVGTVLECDMYVVPYPSDCWLGTTLGFAKSTSPFTDNCGASSLVEIGYSYSGGACWADPPAEQGHGKLSVSLLKDDGTTEVRYWMNDSYLSAWHRYKIAILPDRHVEFYVDDSLIYTSVSTLNSQISGVPILLGRRSYRQDSLIDNVTLNLYNPTVLGVDIWVDKGCGSTYRLGDYIRIYGRSSVAVDAAYVVQRPDGTFNNAVHLEANQDTILGEGYLDGPAGQRTYTLRATYGGETKEKSCSINVSSSIPPAIEIGIDKGCGATYCLNESIAITMRANVDGTGTLIDRTPDGRSVVLRTISMTANATYRLTSTISPPTGSESVVLQFRAIDGRTAEASCSFVVANCDVRLSLGKQVDRSTAKPGDVLTYSLSFTNGGGYEAKNVKLTDRIPSGTELLTGSARFAGSPSGTKSIEFSKDGGATYSGVESGTTTDIRWNVSALGAGSSATVEFKVKVKDDRDFIVQNTASLTADGLSTPFTSSASTQVQRTIPPSAPALSAVAGDSKVDLTWAPSSTGSYPLAGYSVYRKSYSGEFSLVSTLASSTTHYLDGGVANGASYSYFVVAFDDQTPSNESPRSNVVGAVPRLVIPLPNQTDTSDKDGDGKKDLVANTGDVWVQVLTADKGSVVSGAGVVTGERKAIRQVSLDADFSNMPLISTSSPAVLKNDGEFLVYEIDKFYRDNEGRSAVIKWLTIIPKGKSYWLFSAQLINTGYLPIDVSRSPELLSFEGESPTRFLQGESVNMGFDALAEGSSFHPTREFPIVVEYNDTTLGAIGYITPWTTPVDEFRIAADKRVSSIVQGAIIEGGKTGVWQGMLIVDTTASVLSHSKMLRPLSVTGKLKPEAMDAYATSGVQEIFKEAVNNLFDVFGKISDVFSFADLGHSFTDGAMIQANLFRIFEGFGDQRMKPESPLTRAEFSKVMIESMQFSLRPTTVSHFKDTLPGTWYYQFVENAVSYGLVKGYPDKTFKPNNPITKAETVTVIANLLNLSYSGSGPSFADVAKSFWAFSAIEAAYISSIIPLRVPIVDIAGPYFRPQNETRRDIAAVFIVNAMRQKNLKS